MSVMEEVKEKVDYGWLVVRQLDRSLQALSSIDPLAARPGLRRATMTIRSLIALISPVLGDGFDERSKRAYELIEKDPRAAFDMLIDLLRELVLEMFRKGLVHVERIPVGRMEVGE